MQMVGPDWFQVEETVIAALKEENKVTDILINIVRKLLVTQRNLKKKKKAKMDKYINKIQKQVWQKEKRIKYFRFWYVMKL